MDHMDRNVATALILAGSVIVLNIHSGVIALVSVSSLVGVLQGVVTLLLTRRNQQADHSALRLGRFVAAGSSSDPIFLNMLVIVLYIRLDAFLLSVLSTRTRLPCTQSVFVLSRRSRRSPPS